MWALRDRLLKLSNKTNQYKSKTDKLSNHDVNNALLMYTNYSNQKSEIGKKDKSPLKINESIIEEHCKMKYSCRSCARSFNRAYDLKRHSTIHLTVASFEINDMPEASDCLTVPLSESTKISLNTVSKPTVTFTCEVCFRMFKAKDSYERHKRIHTGERPFQCSECSKRFRDSGALTRHVKEVHVRIRNYPCNICNKWFVNRATLEDHLRTHTGERPYVCHQCGIMFKTKSALYQHNKTHSNYLPHICVYCGKCFRRRQELVAHTTIHTNEKSHICEKCGKGFSTRSELQRHIKIHSDEKPFSCLSCGLNFSQKRYLKNHMKSRHGRMDGSQTLSSVN